MPDGATLSVFVVASLVLLVTPGPAIVYIVNRSINEGWLAGVVSSFGLGVGSLFHVAAAWLGMTVVLFSSQAAFTTLKYAGAAYLVYLGVQTLREGDQVRLDGQIDRKGLKRAFSQAIIVNLLNPKAAVFFIAFMPQFVDPSRGNAAAQLLFLCAVFFAMAITTDTMYALLAGRLGNLLRTNPTFRRRQHTFSAAVYILLGVGAALSGLAGSSPAPPSSGSPVEPEAVVVPEVDAGPEVRELTVMAWNIWHGGNDEQLSEDGRPHVIDIIRNSGADIVLMVETYGIGQMVSEALGFDYHLIAEPGTAPDDPDINLSIHSRYPLGERIDFYRYFNSGGIEVELSPTQRVVVFDTWFNYQPWADEPDALGMSPEELVAWERSGTRPDEVTAILDGMQPWVDNADEVPVIMGGDHNMVSHLDWSAEAGEIHGGLVVPWWTSSAVAARGFTDTYRLIHPNPLTHPGITWDMRDKRDEHRIDFIYWVGDKIRPVSSETYMARWNETIEINGQTSMYPSDHGFVLTTFEWVAERRP